MSSSILCAKIPGAATLSLIRNVRELTD